MTVTAARQKYRKGTVREVNDTCEIAFLTMHFVYPYTNIHVWLLKNIDTQHGKHCFYNHFSSVLAPRIRMEPKISLILPPK